MEETVDTTQSAAINLTKELARAVVISTGIAIVETAAAVAILGGIGLAYSKYLDRKSKEA